MKFLMVWLLCGFLGFGLYAANNPNRKVNLRDLVVLTLLGVGPLIVNGFEFVVHGDVCILNCGDE